MQASGRSAKQVGLGLPHLKMKRSLPLEPKGQNFTTHEKLVLLELISSHGRQLVEENDTLSIFRRSRIWRVVYTEFNQHQGVSQRTEKQLRLLWKNLKARCKREFRLNASKYKAPGYVISDPLLRKMSTLIGIEGDIPTRYGRYGDTLVGGSNRSRKVTKSAISGIARKPSRPIRPSQQRPVLDQSLEAGPSQIQIAKTYSMATSTSEDINNATSIFVVSPNQEPMTTASMITAPLANQVKPGRVNMTAPNRSLDHQTAGTREPSPIHRKSGSGMSQEQTRTGEISKSAGVRKADELSFRRRKNTVPRKASEAIKSEVVEIEDDVINLEESEQTCDEYYNAIQESDSNKQPNGDGWLEDAGGPSSSDRSETRLREEKPSSSAQETSRDPVTRGEIPQNNLHHHMPLRARKPMKLQTENKERHLTDDYITIEEGLPPEAAEDGEGALIETLLHDQGQDTGMGVTEIKECSAMEKEMLTMARKEHDMKMTTMLMKRKQIMQIKRREHLAKMENYRLNKEILRLKKRKMELEIRNSLYLEEVEDELDS